MKKSCKIFPLWIDKCHCLAAHLKMKQLEHPVWHPASDEFRFQIDVNNVFLRSYKENCVLHSCVYLCPIRFIGTSYCEM
jgi:hypothetical protein